MTFQPGTIQELCAILAEANGAYTLRPLRLLPRGGGTKPALSMPAGDDVQVIEVSGLSGMLEYQPGEFTFTALAGTRLSEIAATLAGFGQYLPFDPLLADKGATLGGTVAANAAGPGRYHYGGVRDFLIGVRYANAEGQLIRGGGKVVKNAAGFDLPKLMVGSLGGLGVLVELSFKVFPHPPISATLQRRYPNLEEALAAMRQASAARLDLDALDLEILPDGCLLWARIGGLEQALPARLERLCAVLEGCDVLPEAQAIAGWQAVCQFAWVPYGWSLVKIPLTASRIPALEAALARRHCLRRYSAGGQVAWVAQEEPPASLHETLVSQGLNGLVYFGPPGQPRQGLHQGGSFYRRVKSAIDPANRFIADAQRLALADAAVREA